MHFVAETHSHTNACSNAFSTLYENVLACKRKGLPFLCVTEHGPDIPDAPHYWFFKNLVKVVPSLLEGIILLRGAEVNILNYEGKLDLSDKILENLEWVIASYHTCCCEPSTIEDHTKGWLAVAKNPLVDVIGHCGDERFRFDYETVMKEFAKNDKIVEINAHSFECRPGSEKNCREILLLCKKYGVKIVASSDAHFFESLGDCQASLKMMEEVDYPRELILNIDYDRFLAEARKRSGKRLV